jgi:N-acetylmuramoyl-L-alanine amidase
MSKILCIDPGHGGYDPGAVGNGLRESDLNLAVSLTLRDILRDVWGVKVVMTRETDACPVNVSKLSGQARELADLQGRANISDKAGADLILPIHVNSFTLEAHGAEAYVWPGGIAGSLAPNLIKALAPIMGIHGEPVKDGGPNGRNFYMVVKPKAPTVLLELGYINSSDAFKIRDNVHAIALALANVLGPFLGGVENKNKPSTAPAALPNTNVTQADLDRAMDALRAEFKAFMKG